MQLSWHPAAVVQYTFKETNFLAYLNKIISSCIITEMLFYLVKFSFSNNPVSHPMLYFCIIMYATILQHNHYNYVSFKIHYHMQFISENG